jgi:hypothetical protein
MNLIQSSARLLPIGSSVKECSEITRQFERGKAALEDTDQSQLSPTDLLVKTKQARQAIESFSNLVESHSRKMDTILQMLKNAIG